MSSTNTDNYNVIFDVEQEFNLKEEINPDDSAIRRFVFSDVINRLADKYKDKVKNNEYTLRTNCRCISANIEGSDVVVYYEVPRTPPDVLIDYSNTYTSILKIGDLRLIFNITIRLTRV